MKRRAVHKTCALYHRVSTRDQNPTAAARALRKHARLLGLRVVLYADEVASSRANRPELERVMQAARKHTIDAIIVWKLDRFGRSMLDVLTRIRELETLGVRFIASTQGIDVQPDGGAASRYFVNTLAAAAEFERELIVERTHLGLDHARRRGVRLGRPSKRLDMDKIRDMRDRERKSWDEIAGELGVGRATVQRAVERQTKFIADEHETKRQRSVAAAELERQAGVWPAASPGDRPKTPPENGAPKPAETAAASSGPENGRF